jgi:putative transposase
VIELVMEQVLHTAREQDIENLAYCFMLDHVHLPVAGSNETSDLKTSARLMKQRSGWRFGRCHECRLWQPGYYDRVLCSDEATQDIVRYIVENPVRAGLVTSPND